MGIEEHHYELEGSKILSEVIFDIYGNKSRLDFNYDINGELINIEYLGNRYFYIRDALGNINYVVDKNGSIMVKYSYDEWGVPTKTIVQPSCPIGELNPFMYKSYYFDDENLIFLDSKIYLCEIRRFIQVSNLTKSIIIDINGGNMYNYAYNNPINNIVSSNMIVSNVLKYYMYSKGNKPIPHSLGSTGIPNSVATQVLPDGTLYRERVYGPDGKATVDHDHHPGEEVGFDHDHEWEWDGDNPTRGDAKESSKVVAVLGLVATGITLVWLIGNDFSGVGAADDAAIPAVASAFIAFWALLFGDKKEEEEKW